MADEHLIVVLLHFRPRFAKSRKRKHTELKLIVVIFLLLRINEKLVNLWWLFYILIKCKQIFEVLVTIRSFDQTPAKWQHNITHNDLMKSRQNNCGGSLILLTDNVVQNDCLNHLAVI